MTIQERRDYLAEAFDIIAKVNSRDPLVPMWALTDHLVALRDYYESREYISECVSEVLNGEAAAKDYEGDLL